MSVRKMMETRKVVNCQLEVDELRGVVYVHGPNGNTLLRICKIPPIIASREFIDVVFDRELAKGIPSRDMGVHLKCEAEKNPEKKGGEK